MTCKVLITPNETHPHDTLPVYQSLDLNRDHWRAETSATLPLGDVYGRKEMIERRCEANATIAICVA